jgi:hypothetical protein
VLKSQGREVPIIGSIGPGGLVKFSADDMAKIKSEWRENPSSLRLLKHQSIPTRQGETPSSKNNALAVTVGDAAVAQVDFSVDEMDRLKSAVSEYSRQGMSLSGWAKDAILKQANRDLMPGHPTSELEIAVHQALGCIELLKQTCVRQIEEESRYSNGIHRDIGSFNVCGIESIATQTMQKLYEALHGAFDYAVGRPAGQGRAA